jgi:acetate kinase
VRILVVNAGSSSVKLSLIGSSAETLAERELDAPEARLDSDALGAALSDGLGDAEAVGHRVVHGGERFREAVRIDGGVAAALRELVDLAPLHQPKSLAALDAVTAALPDVPAVACFDTAFHATMPDQASTYALPERWRRRWGVRRYGFHGLSHAWIARRVPELLGVPSDGLRVVSCHLGAGASLCAVVDGRSVDTTMGFTPLEGLVMATRSGSVDPGLLLWLLEHTGLAQNELAGALEHESGLLGLTGTADMREVLDQAGHGEQKAQLALAVYVHRLRAGIAAMSAALNGLDVLAFTGGVGQHSSQIRSLAAASLGFLGVAIDEQRNAASDHGPDVSANAAGVRTLVVAAREDLEIARQTREVLTPR